MEIERKYLIPKLPADYETYPHREIEQGYLSTAPVVRIRRSDQDYILTYKGGGMMVRTAFLSTKYATTSRIKRGIPLNWTYFWMSWLRLYWPRWNFPQRKRPNNLSRPTGSERTLPFPGNTTTAY